jgi:hypothetical protein
MRQDSTPQGTSHSSDGQTIKWRGVKMVVMVAVVWSFHGKQTKVEKQRDPPPFLSYSG